MRMLKLALNGVNKMEWVCQISSNHLKILYPTGQSYQDSVNHKIFVSSDQSRFIKLRKFHHLFHEEKLLPLVKLLINCASVAKTRRSIYGLIFAVSDVVRNSLQDGNLLLLAPFIAMGCEVTAHDPLIVANYF